jgi:hypothetical protein
MTDDQLALIANECGLGLVKPEALRAFLDKIDDATAYYLGFSTEAVHGKPGKLDTVRIRIDMVELDGTDGVRQLNIGLSSSPLYGDLRDSVIANLTVAQRRRIALSVRR